MGPLKADRRAPAAGRPLQVVLGVEAAGDGREVVESIRGHHPGVLDADSAETQFVKPRLHGDDVAFSQRLVAGLAKPGLFVHLKPNALPPPAAHLSHSLRTPIT